MALSRGATGLYFLYSSGVVELFDTEGVVDETRIYEGIVDKQRMPTESYFAIKQINQELVELDMELVNFHFHGALSSRNL